MKFLPPCVNQAAIIALLNCGDDLKVVGGLLSNERLLIKGVNFHHAGRLGSALKDNRLIIKIIKHAQGSIDSIDMALTGLA